MTESAVLKRLLVGAFVENLHDTDEKAAAAVLRDLPGVPDDDEWLLSSAVLRILLAEAERPAREALGEAWLRDGATLAEGIRAKCAWLERMSHSGPVEPESGGW